MAYYDGTGGEIWRQSGGQIDYLFAGAATGGTITGIAQKLKERASQTSRSVKVIAVDPNGSILCPDEELNKQHPPSAIG